MNWLHGGEDLDLEKTISFPIFTLLFPLILSALSYINASSSKDNNENNENKNKINSVLNVYGNLYLVIIILFFANFVNEYYSSYLPKNYFVILEKLTILALTIVAGYGVFVYHQTQASRKMLLLITVVTLLYTLPMLKDVPKCIFDNLNTKLI